MPAVQVDKNLIVKTTIEKEGIKFYNIDEEPFKIYGVWKEGDRYYRVPSDVAEATSKNLVQKSTQTAGGRVRFKTDSPYVAVKVNLHNVEQNSMMTVCSTMGLDIYADGVFAGGFFPPFDQNEGNMESLKALGESKMREITIHFPLYSGVKDFYIGIDENARLEAAEPYRLDKPVVYYGSSITNGGCCTRPGMAYEAQISRQLNVDHINLGFGGSCKGELPMAEYIASLSMSAFVYDYDYNARNAEYLLETHKRLFDTVRAKHPTLPIIIITRPDVNPSDDRSSRLNAIKATYDAAIAAGDKNVYFIDGSSFFADFEGLGNEFTVDGVHPTDLGFYLMARDIGRLLSTLI
ncbi:MAG: hypothetical protein IJY69_01265 [Clostridia bacterium]|nr:hypothetical protein [Clostridia bacterium]